MIVRIPLSSIPLSSLSRNPFPAKIRWGPYAKRPGNDKRQERGHRNGAQRGGGGLAVLAKPHARRTTRCQSIAPLDSFAVPATRPRQITDFSAKSLGVFTRDSINIETVADSGNRFKVEKITVPGIMQVVHAQSVYPRSWIELAPGSIEIEN